MLTQVQALVQIPAVYPGDGLVVEPGAADHVFTGSQRRQIGMQKPRKQGPDRFIESVKQRLINVFHIKERLYQRSVPGILRPRFEQGVQGALTALQVGDGLGMGLANGLCLVRKTPLNAGHADGLHLMGQAVGYRSRGRQYRAAPQ